MTTYLVTWDIHVEADSPEEAARRALEIQRDPTSTATVFIINDGTSDPITIDAEEE